VAVDRRITGAAWQPRAHPNRTGSDCSRSHHLYLHCSIRDERLVCDSSLLLATVTTMRLFAKKASRPPRFLRFRSSQRFILFVVAFSLFSDMALYVRWLSSHHRSKLTSMHF
jgi:hypothetical protein